MDYTIVKQEKSHVFMHIRSLQPCVYMYIHVRSLQPCVYMYISSLQPCVCIIVVDNLELQPAGNQCRDLEDFAFPPPIKFYLG